MLVCGICLGFGLMLVSSVVAYLRWNFDYWQKRHVNGPEPQLMVGNFPRTNAGKCNLVEELHELYLAYKHKQRCVGVFTGRNPRLFILDPKLALQLLTQHFQCLRDNESAQWTSPRVEELRLCSPYVCTGEAWKERRSELTVTLTTNRIRAFYPSLRSCATKMLEFLKSHAQQPLDGKDLANRFTAEFISDFIWGIEANAFVDGTPSTIQQMASAMIAQGLACVRYYGRTAAWSFARLLWPTRFFPEHTDRFFQKLALETLEMRRQTSLDRCDVINHLLQLKDKKSLSDTQIAGHTTTVLIDGFEAGAMLIAHCLLLLSRNQRVQHKLREELGAAVGENDVGLASYNTLNELPYLEQCLQETLRIFPPLTTLFKTCTKALTIETTDSQTLTLRPNDVVYISSYSFHRDPDYFEDPERFWPERFDLETGGTKKYRDMGVFLPFGDGPRMCPGIKLALSEAKMAVAEIVRHFHIRSSANTRKDNKISANSSLICLDGSIELSFEKLYGDM